MATRDVPRGTRSLLSLAYNAAAVAAVWTAMTMALKACVPQGQRGPPSRHQLRCGGGWGQSMSAFDVVANHGLRIHAAGPRGYSRPLRFGENHPAAPPTGRPPAARVALRGGEQEGRRTTEAPKVPLARWRQGAALRRRSRVVSGGGQGGERVSSLLSRPCLSSTRCSPFISREVTLGALQGSGSPGPLQGGPKRLGGRCTPPGCR